MKVAVWASLEFAKRHEWRRRKAEGETPMMLSGIPKKSKEEQNAHLQCFEVNKIDTSKTKKTCLSLTSSVSPKMNLRVILLLLVEVSLYTAVSSGKVCGRPKVSDSLEVEAIQRVYEPGEEVVIACARGYTRSGGSRIVICTKDGEWGKVTLKCAPITCPPPEKPLHGKVEVTNIVYKSTINYTCDEGYILNGTTTSTCMHDGKWTCPPPVCEPVTCALAPIPKNAKIIYDKKPDGNIVTFGFSGRYECAPPFALFGNERAHCAANGNWTEPPECRTVVCPVPAGIPHGFITFAVMREHGYKERVKYGCDESYVMDGAPEIECEKTGQWSPKPACRAPCTIGIKRGRIFYNGKKIWIEDFKPNRLRHNELVVMYCMNKEKKCGYPVATECIDGTLKIPDCFEEPSKTTYNLNSRSLPSEINMCR